MNMPQGTRLEGRAIGGIPVILRSVACPKRNLLSWYSASDEASVKCKRRASVLHRINKIGKKADVFANGIREHVNLSPKISEAVKGKLRLGARIIQMGGMEKAFKTLFNVDDNDRLVKASQCYLSTSAGPIAGLLFISTHNIAFCSERSFKMSYQNGESIRLHYKVLIPMARIGRANESENTKRPTQKYLQLVTVDDFEFWFMGFLNYHKTLKHLQQTISQTQMDLNN